MPIENWLIWLNIIGFVATWLISGLVWVYGYGKLRGHVEAKDRHNDLILTEIKNKLMVLEKAGHDLEGNPKYLTKTDHKIECMLHSEMFAMEMSHLKNYLGNLQSSVTSIQDSILNLATSGRLRGGE